MVMCREEEQFGLERKRESTETVGSKESKSSKVVKKGDISSFFKRNWSVCFLHITVNLMLINIDIV